MWKDEPIKSAAQSAQAHETIFNEWYQQHWELLFKLAVKKTGSADDAYDLVHDLFADLWRNPKSLSVTGAVKTYLVACLYHKVFNYFRTKGLRTKHYKNLETFLAHQAIIDPSYALSQYEEEQETIRLALEQAINGMPDKMKDVFIRNYYYDQSLDQIASELHVSKQTVKNQLTIASKRLRRAVKHFEPKSGQLHIFTIGIQIMLASMS